MEKLDFDNDFKESMIEFDICKKYARQIVNSFPFSWGSGTLNLNDFAAFIAEIRSDAVATITLKLETENKRLQKRVIELENCLKTYITEYSEWEESITQICGRQPQTGIHLQRAITALED